MDSKKKKKRLIEKEIRFVATRGRDGEGGEKELEKGGQKVQISSHKISRFWGWNVQPGVYS